MVAKTIGKSPNRGPAPVGDEALEYGLWENVLRQLAPLLERLKNRWVIAGLFIIAYLPFGLNFVGAYQDNTVLRERINGQKAVLALPEPRTDDIEAGLRSWTSAFQAATDAQDLELEDSTLIEQFVATAIAVGVSVESIATSDSRVIPVGIEAYEVTPVLLRVSGSLAGLENFVALIEGDAVEALEVKTAAFEETETGFIGSINAIVFNRPVDPSELSEEQQEELSRRVTDEELDAAAAGTGSGR